MRETPRSRGARRSADRGTWWTPGPNRIEWLGLTPDNRESPGAESPSLDEMQFPRAVLAHSGVDRMNMSLYSADREGGWVRRINHDVRTGPARGPREGSPDGMSARTACRVCTSSRPGDHLDLLEPGGPRVHRLPHTAAGADPVPVCDLVLRACLQPGHRGERLGLGLRGARLHLRHRALGWWRCDRSTAICQRLATTDRWRLQRKPATSSIDEVNRPAGVGEGSCPSVGQVVGSPLARVRVRVAERSPIRRAISTRTRAIAVSAA